MQQWASLGVECYVSGREKFFGNNTTRWPIDVHCNPHRWWDFLCSPTPTRCCSARLQNNVNIFSERYYQELIKGMLALGGSIDHTMTICIVFQAPRAPPLALYLMSFFLLILISRSQSFNDDEMMHWKQNDRWWRSTVNHSSLPQPASVQAIIN